MGTQYMMHDPSGLLLAQLRARIEGLLKNVWFSEILEEN